MPTFALMKQEKETNSPSLHLQQQQLLLRMEYEYEKEEFRRQTETMGVARKVKRGMCWFPVTTGRSYYNSLNQLVLEVTRTEDTDIEHNFEYGRPVCFFRQTADGSLSYYNFQGSVSYADETRMVVVMPGAGAILDIQAADRLGVQLYFDETSYRTMFEALADVLDIVKVRDIQARATQPIWTQVRVPASAPAGTYKGTLTVSGQDLEPMELRIEVDVTNRVLPAPKEWAFHLDLWQNPYAVARYYQVPLWSEAHFEAMRPIMRMLADAGFDAVLVGEAFMRSPDRRALMEAMRS